MPIVNVKVLAGVFSDAQKQSMIDGITDTIVRIGGDGIRPNVQVLVEDIQSGMWGIGGKKLTIEEVEARRRERAAKGTS